MDEKHEHDWQPATRPRTYRCACGVIGYRPERGGAIRPYKQQSTALRAITETTASPKPGYGFRPVGDPMLTNKKGG